MGRMVESALKPGTRFDRFQLERRLGEGSFAEVWLAIEEGQRGFSKRVALKILRAEAAKDPEVLALLAQEARLCAMLHHPGLVAVYGVATSDDTTFVAMEYVDGPTLNHLDGKLREAGLTMPSSVILDVGIAICESLDHAHNATDHEGLPLNLVHRDMKPGNVMLTRLGVVKLTDFGLAKASTSTIETQDGMLRGTPLYVAPEIWNGSRDFQPTVDLFGVGAILWELAVGQKMLAAPDLVGIIGMAINGSAEGDAQRLRMSRPELARPLVGLLEREPEQRTQSAWQARADMQEARRAVDAPGGLDLFMALVSPVLGGERLTDRRLRQVPATNDPAWLALLTAAAESGVTLSSTSARVPSVRDVEPPPVGGVQPTRLVPIPPGGSSARLRRRAVVSRAGWLALLALAGGLGLLLAMLVGPGLDREGGDASVDTPDPAVSPGALTQIEWGDPEPGDPDLHDSPSVEPEVVPSVPAAGEPSPAHTPRPVTTPTPAPDLEATAAPQPATPAPAATPAEVPTPLPDGPDAVAETTPPPLACLQLVSSPPGARVWLDGQPAGVFASSRGTELSRAAGDLRVAMGVSDEPTATFEASLTAGERTAVRCDLVAGSCRAVPAGRCP